MHKMFTQMCIISSVVEAIFFYAGAAVSFTAGGYLLFLQAALLCTQYLFSLS